MSSTATVRQQERPSRRSQLVVWALLAVLVGIGAYLASTGATASGSASVSATQTVAADSGSMVVAADNVARNEALTPYYSEAGSKNPIDLLPAWRWQSATELRSDLGITDVAGSAMSFFAEAMFFLASWVWALLLGLVRFGLGLDLVNTAASAIDAGFKGLTDSIWTSGIVYILLVAAFIMGIRMAMKGQGTKAVGLLVALIVPVAFMQALATQVDSSANTAGENYASPKGSPSWLASQGVAVIDSTAAGLGSGFGLVSGATDMKSPDNVSSNTPDCYSYNQTLYSQYSAFTNGSAPVMSDRDEQELITRPNSARSQQIRADAERASSEAAYNFRSAASVPVVSYLWERAYLQFYTNALVSDNPDSSRITCHFLEQTAGTSAQEQAAIGAASGYPGGAGEDAIGPYLNTGQDSDEWESRMLAWAACKNDGEWKVANAAWEKGGLSNEACNSWWTGASNESVDGLKFNDPEDTEEAFSESKAEGNPELVEQLNDARNTGLAIKGENSGDRFLNGAMALVTGIVYLYALGALAVGAIIAQFGLVLLLILLPATLLLLAMPSGEKGRHPAGKRLLKLTGSFMAAKLVLTIVMTILIQTIMTFEALAETVSSSGLGGIVHAIIPLVALFLLRYLLKKAGLGDLTKLQGAVGMTSAAAMAAGGDKNGRGMWSTGAAAVAGAAVGNRLGLNRADAAAKKAGAIAGRKAGRGALWAPKKALNGATAAGAGAKGLAGGAAGAAAGFLGLGNRAAALVGRKAADGTMAQLGLKQQMGALAAASGFGVAAGALGAVKGLPGAKSAQAHMARRQQAFTSRKDLAALQRADMRDHITATKFKGREGRLAAAADRFSENEGLQRARVQMAALGMDDKAIAAAGLAWNPETREASFTRNGNLERVGLEALSPTEVREDFLGYSGAMDLKEAQVVGNQLGLGATYIPVPRGNSSTAKLVQAKTEAKTIELAQDVLQYVPDHLKSKRPGWSDDQYSTYLHGLRVAAGGIDPKTGAMVDVAKEHGIDLETEAGKAELRKALEGEASKFDSLQGTIQPSSVQVAALVARVSKMGRGGPDSYEMRIKALDGDSPRQLDAEQRIEIATTLRDEAKSHTNSLQSHKAALTEAAERVRQLTSQSAEKRAQVQKVELDLSEIETAIAQGNASERTEAAQVKIAGNLARLQGEVAEATSKIEMEEETMQNAISAMFDDSMRATEAAAVVQKEAKGLELNHDMFLASKRGKDLAPIMDAAELFDKQFAGMRSGMQQQVLAAQKVLMDAFGDGDSKAVRAAAEDLDRLIRRSVTQAESTASKAIGLHTQIDAEQALTKQRDAVAALRYGQPTGPKRRGADIVGAATPLPR